MEELMALAERCLRIVQTKGVDQSQVLVRQGKIVKVDLEKSQIKSSNAIFSRSLFLRCYKKGGMGYVSSSDLSEMGIKRAASEAYEFALNAQPDPEFRSLPQPEITVEAEGIYDPNLAQLPSEEVAKWAIKALKESRSVWNLSLISGAMKVEVNEYALVNSLGVAVTERATRVSAEVFAVVKKGDEVGSYYDFAASRKLEGFQVEGLGERTTRKALDYLGARKVKTITCPVVFGPLATGSILRALCEALDAEAVQRKRSFMAGRKGEEISSPLLSLVDDGLFPGGLYTSCCDGEGTPHRPVEVIKKGVLLTYLHNSYTAYKSGETNTGHATFSGGISPTNIRPEMGERKAEEIVREVKEGIFVDSTWIYPHPASGDISNPVDFGFKIEKGEITYPVKNVLLGMNFIDLLRNISGVSSDYRDEPGNPLPTIRVEGVRVAGGG